MLQAMFSGVSGLQAHQTKLDVIGNNIANVNTVGFKSGDVTFEDQLSQTIRNGSGPSASVGGLNPAQVGLGVSLGAINTNQTQGNLQATGKSSDLAIQGNGFFLVSSGSNTFFTRDGSFDLDSDGVLVNSSNGVKLLGYVADAKGTIDSSQQITADSVLKIPVGTLTSVQQTTSATFQGNLDASASLQTTHVNVSGELDTSSAPGPMTGTIFDASGGAHAVSITLSNPVHTPAAGPGVPVGATQRWDATVSIDNVAQPVQRLYAVPNGSGGNNFVFADNANPANSTGSTLSVNVAGTAGAPNFPVAIDFSKLQAQSAVTTSANGQAGASPVQSSLLNLEGSLNLDGGAPVVNKTTVFDAAGSPFTITTTLSNPTVPTPGANVPAGAAQQWQVKVDVADSAGNTFTAYDSSVAGNQESAAYFVPGTGFVTADGSNPAQSLGSTIQLVGGALPAGAFNQGRQVATNFPLTIDLSGLGVTKTASIADGQTGASPVSNASVVVYDSLGIKHNINLQFTRELVGAGAPPNASAQWNWTATENGNPVADSSTAGNSPLYFDNQGGLIDTSKQKIILSSAGGAGPLPVAIDFGTLTQVSGASSVAATSQDGFPVGTLQSYQISEEGLITGSFSNGQSRTLGQVATAGFSNASGLEKVGQNLFQEGSNSGLAQVGLPSVNGRGKISTGFVEMSNVDLSTEFTNLIVTQRGFEANTKIVTAVDELLQAVINLKR
ncbi:MAG TPA: flagellar hook-basal body complex protein [Chthonomonadaceae bacterium]|nr:flagellar hook-basal body complex protein [Chthonomonadaceae bacterium]